MIGESATYVHTEIVHIVKEDIPSTPVIESLPPAIISEVPNQQQLPENKGEKSKNEEICVITNKTNTIQEETIKVTVSCLDSYPNEDFANVSLPFKFRELEQSERIKRLKWIRKVFSIATVQLFISFLWSLLLLSNEIREGFKSYIAYIVILSLGVILVLLLMLVKRINTSFPYNYICAGVYAICQGHLFCMFGIHLKVWMSILIIFLPFAFALGMTIYVWIVKEQYYYTVSYLCGFFLYAISAVISVFIIMKQENYLDDGYIIIVCIMVLIVTVYFAMSFRIMDVMGQCDQYTKNDTCLACMYLFTSSLIFTFILAGVALVLGFTLISLCGSKDKDEKEKEKEEEEKKKKKIRINIIGIF